MKKIWIVFSFSLLICMCGCAVAAPNDMLITETSVASQSTTSSNHSESIPSLCMPDEIIIDSCYSSATDLFIQPIGEHSIRFYTELDGEKIVNLTSQEVETINSLYQSITDFSNLSLVEDFTNVTLIDNGKTYYFCDILTTQEELEQLLGLLQAYYSGVEYDWKIVERETY